MTEFSASYSKPVEALAICKGKTRQMEERVDTEQRSRHVPKEVVSELVEKARHRCCLCRVLIDPERFDDDALFGSLEKHHIYQFSEGGGHTYDNLLLACANCHVQIHKHPDKYPIDELREKKRHWVEMVEVVPAELKMVGETEDAISIPFSVLSLNLQYSILASPQATVADLALFVGENILKPLGEYDDHENWLEPEKVGLARCSADKKLDRALRLGEIRLAPDDALTGRVPKIVVPLVIPPVPDFATRRHPFEPELVHIPAGNFWMGTNRLALEMAGIKWSSWMEYETPYHQVYLPDDAIGRYPVTNAEYARFVADTGCEPPEHWEGSTAPKKIADHPVYVTWNDAIAYCQWLSKVTGKPFTLPSESEWEKAARGTDGRLWPWGNRWNPARCNTREKGPGRTTPVGQYSPWGDSPYGVADMAGNVWEWTRSLYRGYPYDSDDGREDLGGNGIRVLRGGSFYGTVNSARSAARVGWNPHLRLRFNGLRVVVAAPFSPASAL